MENDRLVLYPNRKKKNRFPVSSDFNFTDFNLLHISSIQHSNERGKYKQGTKRYNLAYSEQNCRGFKTREA